MLCSRGSTSSKVIHLLAALLFGARSLCFAAALLKFCSLWCALSLPLVLTQIALAGLTVSVAVALVVAGPCYGLLCSLWKLLLLLLLLLLEFALWLRSWLNAYATATTTATETARVGSDISRRVTIENAPGFAVKFDEQWMMMGVCVCWCVWWVVLCFVFTFYWQIENNYAQTAVSVCVCVCGQLEELSTVFFYVFCNSPDRLLHMATLRSNSSAPVTLSFSPSLCLYAQLHRKFKSTVQAQGRGNPAPFYPPFFFFLCFVCALALASFNLV